MAADDGYYICRGIEPTNKTQYVVYNLITLIKAKTKQKRGQALMSSYLAPGRGDKLMSDNIYIAPITNKKALDLIKAKNNLMLDFSLGSPPKYELLITARVATIMKELEAHKETRQEKYLQDTRSEIEYVQSVVANHYFELKLIEAIKLSNPEYDTIYKSGTDTEGFCLDANQVTGAPDITLTKGSSTYYLEIQTGNSTWDTLQIKKHKITNADKYNNYRILFIDAFRGKYAVIDPHKLIGLEYSAHLPRMGNKAGYTVNMQQEAIQLLSYRNKAGIQIEFK